MAMSKTMQDALSGQLHHEFESAYLYLAMSAHLSRSDLHGAAHWMRLQAQEELQHAMKLYDFVESRGEPPLLKGVEDPPSSWGSAVELFSAALDHERLMTDRLNTLVDLAIKERDHASHSLLQWFIDEQVEEEATLDTVIGRLKLAGSDGAGMFLIDAELAKRVLPAAAGGAP